MIARLIRVLAGQPPRQPLSPAEQERLAAMHARPHVGACIDIGPRRESGCTFQRRRKT